MQLDKYLGSEFDLVTNYMRLIRLRMLNGALAVMAATKSMEYAKGITPNTAKLTGYMDLPDDLTSNLNFF